MIRPDFFVRWGKTLPVCRLFIFALTLCLCASLLACGEEGDPSTESVAEDQSSSTDRGSAADQLPPDMTPPPPPLPQGLLFEFSEDPVALLDGPFPSALHLDPSVGRVKAGLLSAEPRAEGWANLETIALFEERMSEREAFSFTSVIWLPIDAPLDLESLEGRVHLQALDGPGCCRPVELRFFWSEAAQAVGVFPLWTDAMLPKSRYGLWIESGVVSAAGEEVSPHPWV
ncbi:MAG: hypothetical protein VYD19_03345, partial [Myxococcota bacterium]|nr:hypothetical protein [Myxococcota bacterium]